MHATDAKQELIEIINDSLAEDDQAGVSPELTSRLVDSFRSGAIDKDTEVFERPLDLLTATETAHDIYVTFSEGPPLPLTPDQPLAALLAFSWWALVHRQAKATLTLVGAGQEREAAPNARASLESAIMLAALSAAHGAGEAETFVQQMLSKFGRDLRGLLRSSESMLIPDEERTLWQPAVQQVMDLTGALNPDAEWLRRLEQVCARIHNGGMAYFHYRSLSMHSHGSLQSLMPHLIEGFDSGELCRRPRDTDGTYFLAVTIWACVSADLLVDSFLRRPFVARARLRQMEGLGFQNLYGLAMGGIGVPPADLD